MYKHSFYARKVVPTMDERERREKSSAIIRVEHPKQKKRGKSHSEKLHQKQLPLSLLLLL